MKRLGALALGLVLLAGGMAGAKTMVDLQFDGSGSTLEATGFDGAYGLDPAFFNVGGGFLTIFTAPGDTFGQYENDPDSARNFFYSEIEPLEKTIVEARAVVRDLTQNFHGGGIWLGTDQDHYIRLAPIHNSWEGGVVVEALRENEDLWTNLGGPGGDIISRFSAPVASPGQEFTIWLRLIREGNTAQVFYSLNGLDFVQVGGVFDAITTGPADGATVEGSFKVGVYALGGGNGSVSFDYFTATSVPEPGSLTVLALGLAAAASLRRRR